MFPYVAVNDKAASAAKHRPVVTVHPIEEMNLKSDEQFIMDHLRPSCSWTEWVHPRTQKQYSLSIAQAGRVSPQDLKMCLGLVEETSKSHYEASSRGWKPRKKLAEMKSPEMRYIMVKDAKGGVRGFTSFMPTFEEGQPVVYCYEIHLKPEMQGTGLGALLMGFHDNVAYYTPTVEKIMLTCFLKNQHALEFYLKLGFEIDPISPSPKKLRFGKQSTPDYIIMSKTIR
ncbi:acyl-CoA N-acyltransferase [Xylariales sp. AK1849]|nr:acyl-CoA N-acyltransferase [Xylariales sp. AK1849]